MKRFLPFFTILTALFLLFVPASAATKDGDYTYIDYPDGTCVLQGYLGSEEEVTVPASHSGYQVTAIAPFAFFMPDASVNPIRKIVVEEGIETISQYAFYGCGNLEEIILPDSIQNIEQMAFQHCSRLKRIHIPEHVSFIHRNAFSEMYSDPEIDIDDSLFCLQDRHLPFAPSISDYDPDWIKEQKDQEFIILGKTLLKCNSKKSNLVIPDGVEAVIDLPDTATSVTFGPDVKYLDGSFHNVTSIQGGENISYVGNNCFSGRQNSLLNENGFFILGHVLVRYSGTETEITVPDGITMIGFEAFTYGDSTSTSNETLRSITLPDTVEIIAASAFLQCKALEEINIPSSVKEIGGNPFVNCFALTPEGVRSANERFCLLGDYLYDVTTDTIISFLNRNATSITLPEQTKRVRKNAFTIFQDITSLSLPYGLQTIGVSAFSGCIGLTQVTIPDTVYLLGDKAFENCSQLKTVDLGRGVTGIGYYSPFHDCRRLLQVVARGNIRFIRTSAIGSDDDLTIYGPSGSVAQYYAADYRCRFSAIDDEPILQAVPYEGTPSQEASLAPLASLQSWYVADYTNGSGRHLYSDSFAGECTLEKETVSVNLTMYLEAAAISFGAYTPEGNSLFTFVGEKSSFHTVLIRSSSGWERVAKGLLYPNDSFLYLSNEPEVASSLTLYDALIAELAAGETLDFWFTIPYWMGESLGFDAPLVIHAGLQTDAPAFTQLYEGQVAENWGLEGEAFKPASVYDYLDDGWNLYTNDTDGGEYLDYLCEGIAVSEEGDAKEAYVEVRDEQGEFSFVLWLWEKEEFIFLSPVEGNGFYLDAGLSFLETGDVPVYAYMEGGTGFVRAFVSEDESSVSPLFLQELMSDGNVEGKFTLSYTDAEGESSYYDIYFKLPAYYTGFKATLQEAIQGGWGQNHATKVTTPTDTPIPAPTSTPLPTPTSTPAPTATPLPLPTLAVTSDDPEDWDWQKRHFDNGTMYIMTRYQLPGKVTYNSGASEGAYFCLYQYYNGF